MQLEPYLFFHGRCEEALNFYRDCLRGEIVGMNRFAGSPMEGQVDAGYRDKIMHATFVAGDVKFMASDGRPGEGPDGEDDVTLCLSTSDAAEGERVFNALAQDGEVTMPLEEAFWGGRFGSLTDRFGVHQNRNRLALDQRARPSRARSSYGMCILQHLHDPFDR